MSNPKIEDRIFEPQDMALISEEGVFTLHLRGKRGRGVHSEPVIHGALPTQSRVEIIQTASHLEEVLPLITPPLFAIAEERFCYDEPVKGEPTGRHGISSGAQFCFWFGAAQVPTHPAVTRTWMSCCWARCFIYDFASMATTQDLGTTAPEQVFKLLNSYAEVRGFDGPTVPSCKSYGLSLLELAWHDIRVAVLRIENGFWPHKAPYPEGTVKADIKNFWKGIHNQYISEA